MDDARSAVPDVLAPDLRLVASIGGWTTLSWFDANVWRHIVPKGWFYNVMSTGVKPS